MANQEKNEKEKEFIQKEIVKDLHNKVMEDVTKEIKTTIIEKTEEFKNDIKEDLIEDINAEFVERVNLEERKILKSKNASIFKRDIVILILFGFFLYFGYCLYDARYFDFMKSDCERAGNCGVSQTNTENVEEGNEEKEEVKDKDWYIKNYGYLLGNIQLDLNADSVSAYYLYSMDRKVSEMKSSALLNLAYQQLNSKKIKTNSVSITVEGSSLREAFQKVFGSLTYYKPSSFTYKCLNFKYNAEKDKYTADNTKCSTSTNQILEEIEDIYEEGDVLYIITYAAIYNESEKSYYTFDDLYEPVATDVTEVDLSTNARKLNRYQYQFKKNEEEYYLDSIIKLK